MIKILIGNLFETQAKTIVNTVNCVGVMGKGIAQAFKKQYPSMFKDYVLRCDRKEVLPGVPYLYTDLIGTSIINFPTKKHWRSPSKLDDVINGIEFFIENYKGWGIESIAFPPLGCGNGGLEWSVVGPIIYQRLSTLDIDIELYAPYGTPKKQLEEEFLRKANVSSDSVKGHKNKKISAEWITLLEVVNRLQKLPYANPVGRVIFQKICYIFTEQGVDTGFIFKQGSYGPFSPEVKEAISVFANSNLIQEQQLGRMTALQIGSEYERIKNNYLEKIEELDRTINRTVDLFSRIKTTSQAEDVTTVLYAARYLKSQNESVTEEDIYNYIFEWKKTWEEESKQLVIASAIRNLEMLGWLKVKYSDSLESKFANGNDELLYI